MTEEAPPVEEETGLEEAQQPTPFPLFTGLRQLIDTEIWSLMISYSYNGAQFFVLVSAREHEFPPDYRFDESIEGKVLIELSELSYGEPTEEKDDRLKTIEPGPGSPPSPTTMQEQLYPETHILQVLTREGQLVSLRRDDYELDEKYSPIPEEKLRQMNLDDSVPVVEPRRIKLGHRLQSCVWKVCVDGEDMICKISYYICKDALGEELDAYLKLRGAAEAEAEAEAEAKERGKRGKSDEQGLKVPKLKGIVRSHTGVIGILLGYIPHRHHSLRVLLDHVEDGTVPGQEATASMKRKWAEQIKQSLARLHALGIMWRDIKTDNILIDEDGDAVVIDFGGGNTVGWVDHDKYGTMEGEQQGLDKILHALCQTN
ncbi:hypothetical protein PT974_01448 [Cladobotryum mycophilum]|uniref:Protein kinase domain-containing protein n=1 Tax=Cladobotryum mycophilum TaxID=491253 RepID=A0ABR0T4U5_9HYPO